MGGRWHKLVLDGKRMVLIAESVAVIIGVIGLLSMDSWSRKMRLIEYGYFILAFGGLIMFLSSLLRQ